MKQELKQFVEQNPKLVSQKPCQGYPGLFILKYTRRVFFDGLWNDLLEECRGTIIDGDYNVVSRPFTKIYNYGVEERSPVIADDVKVAAFRKVNGFMCAVTWYQGDLLISTTGSTANDYVNMARELLDIEKCRAVCSKYPHYTFVFECVHRHDPHVVPESEGMYLLGYRDNTWESVVSIDCQALNLFAQQFGVHQVESQVLRMDELLKLSKQVKHEGFVFYTPNGVSAKIKSPHYLTCKWMARNPRTDKLLTKEFKEQIDEEYYPMLAHIRENIQEFTALAEQERLTWIRNYLEN